MSSSLNHYYNDGILNFLDTYFWQVYLDFKYSYIKVYFSSAMTLCIRQESENQMLEAQSEQPRSGCFAKRQTPSECC